ncbi:asparagine synthase-related protein [Spirulina sp. CCNP1310]|uniref:asparagine synthetase B family protein n=1 Tax=Spirulina sp. CCNP1310 TaxID=3110249 RepID=UPI002B1F01F2|nr:asparagine synthase-related protein [Spirulina sp. CCNP1310]MEA5420047.1 asparagine synthase-related protein [Spirulina sp. CCNP1310]
MSGWFALWHREGQRGDPQVLQAILQTLTPSGPDAQTLWQAENLALGHTLLAIRPECPQPLTLDGEVYLTSSVRLDGAAQLRRNLGCGSRVTEPELLLRAYLAWGEACLTHLQGDFAFAIWDGRQQRLFCGRDQLGVKPLYYAQLGPLVVVSTAIAPLRTHPAVSEQVNEEAIADFLLFDFNHNPHRTTFQDIQSVPGGHLLRITPEALTTRRYWTLPVPEALRYRDPQQYLEAFHDHLKTAVGDRLPPDQPAAILLSGGLDSGILAAMAQDLHPGPLQAYTIGYQTLIPDTEPQYSHQTAQALQIPLQTLWADDAIPFSHKPASPEPSLDPTPQFTAMQYGLIAQQSRVLLYGQGGDEGLRLSTVGEMLRGMPWHQVFGDLWACLFTHKLRPHWGTGLRAKLRRSPPDPWAGYPHWLAPDFAARVGARERWQSIRQQPDPVIHPYRHRAYRSLLQPLWRLNFETSDPGYHGFPLEIPFPFLDLRLLDFLLAVPPLPWFVDKTLIRATLRQRYPQIPPTITERPKTPLAGHPILVWLQRGLNPWDIVGEGAMSNYLDLAQFQQAIPAQPVGIGEVWPLLRAVHLAQWLPTK